MSATLWLKAEDPEPTVPVTVSVEVPAGVPGLCVMLGLLPPRPHPASARASNNPEASGTMLNRPRPALHHSRRATAHAIPTRTKASINRTLKPGDGGGAGGRGRKRGGPVEAAFVVTVTVTFVAEFPGVTELGEIAQVV